MKAFKKFFVLIVLLAICVLVIFNVVSPYYALPIKIIILLLTFSLIFYFFLYGKLISLIYSRFKVKEECPHFSEDTCPYEDISQCPYDRTKCHIFRKNKKKKYGKNIILGIILISSILILTIQEKCSIVDGTLKPLAMSFIAAFFVSVLFDLPQRMMEYQEYFIKLLSSSKYLKLMSSTDLAKLRNEITWLLNVKDVPNMPKGLIDIDGKICKMLTKPYFKTYNQYINVNECKNKEMFQKIVRVEYVAHNPFNKSTPVYMDIGMSQCVVLKISGNSIDWKDINKTFKIKEFNIIIDSDDKEYNILPCIDLVYEEKEVSGLTYNCVIAITKASSIKPNNYLDKETIEYENLHKNKDKGEDKPYNIRTTNGNEDALLLKFSDKIKVTIKYEVIIPRNDNYYTKRLRYPVKYFHLHYNINVEKYTLIGQILGTLIDQPNITTIKSPDKKSIILKTDDWLLPKNGAVVFHCKEEEKNEEEEKQ